MLSATLVRALALVVGCIRMPIITYTDKWPLKHSASANTMSSALEVLGMSLPYSSSTPAMYPGLLSRIIHLHTGS